MPFVTVNRVRKPERIGGKQVCARCGRARSPVNFPLIEAPTSSLVQAVLSGRMPEQAARRSDVCAACYDPAKEQERQWTRRYRGQLRRSLAALWGAQSLLHPNPSRRRLEAVERATPLWVDELEIARLHEQAQARTAATGIPHHVDHIVPIQGRAVCGLHVPCNLRILAARKKV